VKVKAAQEEIQELDDLARVIADVEIIGTVNTNLKEDGMAMDMNNINETYNNLIRNDDQTEENHKRYLKALLKENIPVLFFSRPPCCRMSEQLCSSNYQVKAIALKTTQMIIQQFLRQQKLFGGRSYNTETGSLKAVMQVLNALLHYRLF